MKLLPIISLIITLISPCAHLLANETVAPQSAEQASVAVPSTQEAEHAAPLPAALKPASEIMDTTKLLTQTLFYLGIMVGIGALIIWVIKRGNLPINLRKKASTLRVAETHMLGNKQFLIVVEYEEQKLLLGVGPGMINYLTHLSTPFEDKLAETQPTLDH